MDKKNKKELTDRDAFLRYRSDRMTERERNAFERELQKDPFTEEAAEGYSGISPEEAKNDLSLLTDKIARRSGRKHARVYYRIAAAVAVLISLSVILYNYSESEKLRITQFKASEKQDDSTIFLTIAESESFRKESETGALPAAPPQPKPEAPQLAVAEDAAGADEEKQEEIHIISAVQEDTDNEMTGDAEEEAAAYDIPAREKETEYMKKSNMKEATQMAAPKASISRLSTLNTDPVPVTGIDSFNIYLQKNMRDPDPGNEAEEHVVIRFRVMTDSTISDIKVIESPGRQWSEEAKRLILEGPGWMPATVNGLPVEQTFTLRINFR